MRWSRCQQRRCDIVFLYGRSDVFARGGRHGVASGAAELSCGSCDALELPATACSGVQVGYRSAGLQHAWKEHGGKCGRGRRGCRGPYGAFDSAEGVGVQAGPIRSEGYRVRTWRWYRSVDCRVLGAGEGLW